MVLIAVLAALFLVLVAGTALLERRQRRRHERAVRVQMAQKPHDMSMALTECPICGPLLRQSV